MPITQLADRDSFGTHPKLAKASMNFKELITALEEKNIPERQENKINEIISGLNNFQGPADAHVKSIKAGQKAILQILEKELELVPIGHYQTQWLAIGMAAFGLPFGVVFGMALDNLAFLGIGLPIGMALGIAVGNGKDEEAKKKGKQLNFKNSI